MRRACFCLSLFAIVALLPSTLLAQRDDFGVWYTLSFRKELSKKFTADISEELRTISNATEVDQFFTDLGVSYKLTRYVDVAGYYRFIRKRENNGRFFRRNRFFGELSAGYLYNRVEFGYRFRYQQQSDQYAEDWNDNIPRWYNRHRLELSYNIKGVKLTPSVACELFYRLNYKQTFFHDNTRWSFSGKYKFSKHHSAEISYLINTDLYPERKYLYILSLGYRYSL